MKKLTKSSIYKVSLFSSMVLPAFFFVKQVQGQELVTTVENQQAVAVLQPVVENTELDGEEVVDPAAVGVEVPVFTDPHIQQLP
ncbi:TPA: hypothetical protein ACGOTT_002208, partial [Streptococcus suis]